MRVSSVSSCLTHLCLARQLAHRAKPHAVHFLKPVAHASQHALWQARQAGGRHVPQHCSSQYVQVGSVPLLWAPQAAHAWSALEELLAVCFVVAVVGRTRAGERAERCVAMDCVDEFWDSC